MSEDKHPHHHEHHPDTGPHLPHPQQVPYWQRAHKDWRFWFGAMAIAVAVIIYVCTLDLSSVPWPRH